MAVSSINNLAWKQHSVWPDGKVATVKIDHFVVSIITGGGAYGTLIEDFTSKGEDISNSTFELAIIDKETDEFVTDKLYPQYTYGDQVAPRMSAKEVMEVIEHMMHRDVVETRKLLSQ